MTAHLYLSLLPEALIVSMLPPEEFGQYYATGHHFKSKGQALFFEIDPSFRSAALNVEEAIKRCVPHPDGRLKNSVYASAYRVLEQIPVSAIGKLYVSTAYGQTLAIDRTEIQKDEKPCLHLYQDLAPVNSLVVSTLGPVDHYHSVTTETSKFIRFPALCFVELSEVEVEFAWELDGVRLPLELFMPMTIANPVITVAKDAPEDIFEEVCLSFPKIRGDVQRPEAIAVKYQDEFGATHTLKCNGLLARCVQHEADHLNGVLFIDHMTKKTLAEIDDAVKTLAKATRAAKK